MTTAGTFQGADSPSTRNPQEWLKRNRAVLIFAVFMASLPLWEGPLGDLISIRILYTMRLVGIYTIVAVGLNLLIGYAGQVSLGHAAFFGIGAYTSAILATKLGWPSWITLMVALILAGAVGMALGWIVLRLKGHYLAMATLAMGIIAFVLFRELRPLTGGNDGINYIPHLSLPGLTINSKVGEYFFIWVIAIIVLVIASNIIASRTGRALRALHFSEVAADAMGVNVALHKIKVFALSAGLAGLAGGIFAHIQTFIDPKSFDVTLSIMLVTMVVIGGMSSIWGAVAGAAVITFIPKIVEALPKWFGNVPAWLENYSNYQALILGLILILTMVFMPSGITRGVSDFFKYRKSPFNNPFRKRRWE